MKRYKAHRDSNHKEVADHLRAHGVEVLEIFEPVDLLCSVHPFGVFDHSFVGLIEVKPPGSRTTYQRTQLTFMAHTRFPVCIAKSGEEAIRFLKTGMGLSRKDKDALAAFLLKTEAKKFHPAAIERVLEWK